MTDDERNITWYVEKASSVKLRKLLADNGVAADHKKIINKELARRQKRVYAFMHAGGKR